MHTTPEPRWERWIIGIGEAMTMVWPAAAFHHRTADDHRRDPGPAEHDGVRLRRIGRIGRP